MFVRNIVFLNIWCVGSMVDTSSMILVSKIGVDSKLDGIISSAGSNTCIFLIFESWLVSSNSSIVVKVEGKIFWIVYLEMVLITTFFFGEGED